MSREDWQDVISFADDRIIMIKKSDKGSCVVVWDRNDYLLNTENIISKLLETINKMFSSLKRRGFLTEKQWNILLTGLGRPVISNCGSPAEKF